MERKADFLCEFWLFLHAKNDKRDTAKIGNQTYLWPWKGWKLHNNKPESKPDVREEHIEKEMKRRILLWWMANDRK